VEEDDAGNRWCGAYEVFNNFFNILEKFFIYFGVIDAGTTENCHNKKNSRDLIASILNILIFKNFLIKKIEVRPDGKKHAFYSLNIKPYFNVDWVYMDLKIYFEQPTIIDNGLNKYTCGYHYLSISKVFRENTKSNKIFILKNLPVWEKLKGLKYQLDCDFYLKLSEKIVIKYDLDADNPLGDVFKKYLKSKKMIFLKYFQKKNSLYYNLLIFFYLKKYDLIFKKPFYLSYFFDFRGRLYSDSVISPIGNRMFRFLYNYGLYSVEDLSLIEDFDEVFLKNFQYILDHTQLSNTFSLLELEKPLIKKIISIVFFEFGKLAKSKHIHQFGGRLCQEDFIKIGAEFFKNFLRNSDEMLVEDFELYLETIYLFNILKNYNERNYIKHIIYKDATASAIQLLMILLGSSDIDKVKACNLNNDGYWYDTYYFIIMDFKNSHVLNNTSLQHFTRKNLKKTIMTYNYSATLLTCWRDFSENILYGEDEYQQLFDDFQKFFNFLKKIFDGDIFFKTPSKKLIEFFKKDFKSLGEIKITTSDQSNAYLEYKKTTVTRLDKRYKTIRFTMVFTDVSEELDFRKSYQSLRPNLLHSLDATLVRIVLNKLPKPIITVHDSFGIDILNVDLLIKITNVAMNSLSIDAASQQGTNQYYSKFILI
jgi:hypothetical protein